jgi:hypothetical protein
MNPNDRPKDNKRQLSLTRRWIILAVALLGLGVLL